MAESQDGDNVRLNFIGPQSGNVTYLGKVSKNAYVAGNNADSRVILADPRDVEHLLSLRDLGGSKLPLFELDEPSDKKAAKQLKALQDEAPAGMEWDEELKSYQPVGLRLVNGRWTPVAELAANGTPELDANGNPIVDAFAAGEVGRSIAPVTTDSAALATDRAAASSAPSDGLPTAPETPSVKKAK